MDISKARIESIVQYAIDSEYRVYERTREIVGEVYSHKNICVFGVGEFFRDCADEEHIAHFEYVSDNNPEHWGSYFKGRLCVPPEEIKNIEDCIVVIFVGEWRPIYHQLQEMGISCCPMDWLVLRVYDTHYPKEWFAGYKNEIIDTVDIFADDISKEIYVEALANRMAPPLASKIFNEIKSPGEYFGTGLFDFTEEEYLVDAGAYRGDSLEDFLNAVNNKYGAVYSFELDREIFKDLEKKAAALGNSKILLFQAGVGKESGEIEYSYAGQGQKTRERIVKLDDALKGRKVTFIKMDVEGAEMDALEGARSLILEQAPKLAISAYHFLSDLWRVPNYIRGLNPAYAIYMRHHAPTVWDTDCYAVVR